ncbi:ATP-binding cassette domain-containing protein [Roseateles sp. BYS180W]|uniref:ATP-binding cassette domain-containing protein n=1 Tax=Roseateles rivi TaxID=3299028 RepID=A0ABW7FUG7_9BURK
MKPPLLELTQASKHYQRDGTQVQALQDFDLSLTQGELVGLLGPNGSGKSTLVKVLTGLCGADQGQLRWRAGAVLKAGQAGPHLREFGVLLEGRSGAYERLTPLENARYFCGLREARFDTGHFQHLARALGLRDVHSPVRQLSTGNKLRAALIATLIHRPALVLLDEPTLGLDLEGVEQLQALAQSCQEAGQTLLISSHDLHLIERLCPRIVCISQGHKRFDGPREAFTQVPHPYRLRLRHSQPQPELPPWLTGREWQIEGNELSLPLLNPEEATRLMALWADWLGRSTELQLLRISLREHYLQHLQTSRVATDPSQEHP